MASAGNINFDFTASVSDLEQKAVVAQKIIEDKIGKQIDSIGTKSTVSDKKIVGMMKNIAKEGRAVSPILGKIGVAIASIDAVVVPLYRSFETFFARLQPKLETFGAALLANISSPAFIVSASVSALGFAVVGLMQIFGDAEQKSRAYANALAVVAKAHDEMVESVRIGSLKAALAGDRKGWLQVHIDGLKKDYQTAADELQKITKESEFTIAEIIKGRKDLPSLPQQQSSQDIFEAMTRGSTVTNRSGNTAVAARDKLVSQAREQYAAMLMYEKQLAEITEMEKALSEIQNDKAEEITSNAADTEKAVEKIIAAADKQYESMQVAADKAIEAVEREDAARQEAADREAERAEAERQQHEDRLNLIKLADAQVQQSQYAFYDWAASLQANMADVYQGIQGLVTMATQGIADSFARALVYGESFAEMMDALWKQMAASLISMVIQVALQQLVYLAMSSLMVVAAATTKIAAEMTYGVVAAAASAYASLPFPANMFAAPAAGAAALATMTALAGTAKAAGIGIGAGLAIPGAAHGALVTGDMLMRVGEGGQDELIAPRSDYERLINSARGDGSLHIYLDGQELTRSFARRLPGELRKHGVR